MTGFFSNSRRPAAPDHSRAVLTTALVIGLVIRLAILWQTPGLVTKIVDEQQYSQIARSIAAGDGFAWHAGAPTSIRPPLYPAMLAAIWTAAGSENLQAVRVIQILLALATTALVYVLGARLYGPVVGRWAAAVCWLYPSFIFFNFLILTETLFTLLLVAFVLLTVLLVQTPRARLAVACGVVLGLAALTRSILWPLPLLLCPLLAMVIRAPLARRIALPCLVAIGYTLVVAPWAIRNTRLQGVPTVVDTMGGMNLRMGNYEYTPEDRMWDAVALTGEQSWVYGIDADLRGQQITEGRKEKWAQHKALAFIAAHPGLTLRRSFIKFADFWGLEREFMAGVQSGLYAPARWFEVLASAVIVLAYVAIVISGAAGMWLAGPDDWRMQLLVLLPVLLIMGGHTIVFGHSRYHLPLMPILGVYAAALWAKAPAYGLSHGVVRIGAAISVTALLAVWIRQVAVVDVARISSLLNHVG
ncbi:MAG: glycosyl transferase family 39 [Acidobacteria bacterium]|nr:glycosyl transferase family 39 [Acidobacteriota bacterium]